MKCLAIHSWARVFEPSLLKDSAGGIALPMKRGTGISKLAKFDGGAAAYGIFISLLPIALAAVPRGTLHFSDKTGMQPHDAESLSLVTGFPVDTITNALAILIDIGWLEEVEFENLPTNTPVPRVEDFLTEMKVKLSYNGESLRDEWVKALKGLSPAQCRKIFRNATPGINYPREFVTHRKAAGL